ncbi:hypothetical protein D5S17_21765 [Pseudonocardiaceae bacterium YIM PH 21723]|nr:hypothetical protein D5S17_21765 [Pseudonocardiaceae bacterium YIM PH 21723]
MALVVAAGAAVVSLTACASAGAAPATGGAPSHTPVAVRPTGAGHAPAKKIIGPTGFGRLRLGMSEAEAKATGEITGWVLDGGAPACGHFEGKNANGFFRPGIGIVYLDPHEGSAARTPEGIDGRSTGAQVKAAYPSLHVGVNSSSANVPGHAGNRYGFTGITQAGPDGPAKRIVLFSDKDTCHN